MASVMHLTCDGSAIYKGMFPLPCTACRFLPSAFVSHAMRIVGMYCRIPCFMKYTLKAQKTDVGLYLTVDLTDCLFSVCSTEQHGGMRSPLPAHRDHGGWAHEVPRKLSAPQDTLRQRVPAGG